MTETQLETGVNKRTSDPNIVTKEVGPSYSLDKIEPPIDLEAPNPVKKHGCIPKSTPKMATLTVLEQPKDSAVDVQETKMETDDTVNPRLIEEMFERSLSRSRSKTSEELEDIDDKRRRSRYVARSKKLLNTHNSLSLHSNRQELSHPSKTSSQSKARRESHRSSSRRHHSGSSHHSGTVHLENPSKRVRNSHSRKSVHSSSTSRYHSPSNRQSSSGRSQSNRSITSQHSPSSRSRMSRNRQSSLSDGRESQHGRNKGIGHRRKSNRVHDENTRPVSRTTFVSPPSLPSTLNAHTDNDPLPKSEESLCDDCLAEIEYNKWASFFGPEHVEILPPVSSGSAPISIVVVNSHEEDEIYDSPSFDHIYHAGNIGKTAKDVYEELEHKTGNSTLKRETTADQFESGRPSDNVKLDLFANGKDKGVLFSRQKRIPSEVSEDSSKRGQAVIENSDNITVQRLREKRNEDRKENAVENLSKNDVAVDTSSQITQGDLPEVVRLKMNDFVGFVLLLYVVAFGATACASGFSGYNEWFRTTIENHPYASGFVAISMYIFTLGLIVLLYTFDKVRRLWVASYFIYFVFIVNRAFIFAVFTNLFKTRALTTYLATVAIIAFAAVLLSRSPLTLTPTVIGIVCSVTFILHFIGAAAAIILLDPGSGISKGHLEIIFGSIFGHIFIAGALLETSFVASRSLAEYTDDRLYPICVYYYYILIIPWLLGALCSECRKRPKRTESILDKENSNTRNKEHITENKEEH